MQAGSGRTSLNRVLQASDGLSHEDEEVGSLENVVHGQLSLAQRRDMTGG